MKNVLMVLVALFTATLAQASVYKTFGDYTTYINEHNTARSATVKADNGSIVQIKKFDNATEFSVFAEGKPAALIVDGNDLGATLDKDEMILFKNAGRAAIITIAGTSTVSTKGSGATVIWLMDDAPVKVAVEAKSQTKQVVKPQPKKPSMSFNTVRMVVEYVAWTDACEGARITQDAAHVQRRTNKLVMDKSKALFNSVDRETYNSMLGEANRVAYDMTRHSQDICSDMLWSLGINVQDSLR